jgi:hypothetical protein
VFLPLKLSRINLAEVRRALLPGDDPQTVELVDLLRQPYRTLIDFADERSLGRLREACEAEGVPTPGPDDC